MAEPTAAPPPQNLGGFEILRRLGAGGMAEVFLAKKQGAEGTYKILVLKRVLPAHGASRRFRTMFVEEAQLATRLNHPNIVQVYDFLDDGDEGLLLSMEWVEGCDLGRLGSAARSKGTRVPPWVGAWIVAEAAKGLHYAHERRDGELPLDIVHRDVSPQNILLSWEGAVKIADFGIASASLFREDTGVLKGKHAYMSPEQARGERVDRRSDIWSLGVVAWELLAGRSLHGSLAGDELLEAVRAGVIEPPSTFARDVPPELEAIVVRALARDRDERFQTARDLAGAIARAMMSRQELVDASTLEATLQQLVGREHTSPGFSEPPAAHGTSLPAPLDAVRVTTSARSLLSLAESTNGPARPRVPREVRHVAVLSLRLHGFDELDAALGPAGAAQAVERIRATLDDIAYKRGARWTWESAGVARAVVGLLANPSRAAADSAWLALDTHEALAGASEDLPAPVRASLSIVRGIATGERDAKGHLVRHTLQPPALELASRVGLVTPPGRTWVPGGLYRLVRREFRWGDAPSVEVPPGMAGIAPTTMRIYALERALAREERLAAMALAPSDLVGREAEKAELHAAWHHAVMGTGRLVSRVVLGEMGIGKTALVTAFLAELPPDARVVRVECAPGRTEVPFGAVADLLRDIVGADPEASPEATTELLGEMLGTLPAPAQTSLVASCLTELVTGRKTRAIDEDDLADRRKLVLTGVRRLMLVLAKQSPLVVVVDGAQWSDRAGLDLLGELLRRPEALPILVLVVTRPDDRVEPAIEGLVRVELRGLAPDEQVRLVQARLGVHDGVGEVCAELVARVAGNPFFLLEMVDALLERGALEIREQTEGRHVLVRVERPGERAQPLPSTLEQLIGDRLHELPAPERAAVDWLAVAGGPLARGDLLELADLRSDDSVLRLVARGICDLRGDSLDFRHPVTRDVAYAAIDPRDRTRLHRALGERLAQTPLARGLSAATVARHLARGDAPEAAAALYLEAGTAARAAFQSQLAARHYRRALVLLPEKDGRRLVAHEALEAMYRMLGRRRERRQHLSDLRRLSRELAKPRWVALALARTARLDLDEGMFSAGVPHAQKAEALARSVRAFDIEVDALATLSELLRELGDVQGALAACDRALATSSTHPVPARARGEVLRSRGALLRRVGRVREAVDCYVEAIALFRRTGAKRPEARAKNALAYAMFVLGHYEDAVALALESLSIDLAIGGRFQIAKTLTNIGQSYARLGDGPRALAYLARARDAHERYADQDSRADTLLVSAEALIEQGDLDAAHVLTGDAGALSAVTGSAYDIVHERIVRAKLSRASGDPGAAVLEAYEARQAAETQALVSFTLVATAIEAMARAEIGETHTAILLATTAFGAVENIQGSEYGLEIRSLCCQALERAASPQAPSVRERAAAYARGVAETIRDERLRALFQQRALVAGLLGTPKANAPASELPSA